MEPFASFAWDDGNVPLVAAAVHDGHRVRKELLNILALDEAERLREEDPCTGSWTAVAPNRIVVRHSRFEVDLNRPREKSVYLKPEDAWGLRVWKTEPSAAMMVSSLSRYDAFYETLKEGLTRLENRHKRFIVFDLHSYNHMRAGPGGLPADPELNPDVNLGTGTMNAGRWRPVVDRFLTDLSEFDFLGRRLDVRENVKFTGGHLSSWIHRNFPGSACCLAVEFKKFFMDEWSGQPDERQLQAIHSALEVTVSGALEELKRLG